MIKNLIFDLGGVIVNIDYLLTIKALQKLGAKNLDSEYLTPQTNNQFNLVDKFEIGQVSSAYFRAELKKYTALNAISDKEFDNAWNAMIINLPKQNIDFVTQLRNSTNYNIYLFSNINEIHYKKTFEIVYRDTKLTNFKHIFHKEYYSHLCGFRKPYKESFLKIIQENNLNPKNSLFIDDFPTNIDGAKQAGLQTLLTDNNNMIQQISELI